MARERALAHLKKFGLEDRVTEFDVCTATVELAAQAAGVIPARIAKSLSFMGKEGAMLVVAAGDAKVDNHKFKERFGVKAKMLTAEETETMIGHAVGGVCPFGVEEGVRTYLDVSLKRFETVFPAAGTDASAVRLTCEELFRCAGAEAWVDVCKGWQENTEV